MKYLVTFYTHFDALQYDRFLKKQNVKGRLQPVPRSVSSSCGTCVKFETEDLTEAFTNHEFEAMFRIEDDEYILIIKNE